MWLCCAELLGRYCLAVIKEKYKVIFFFFFCGNRCHYVEELFGEDVHRKHL